jgi:hypothetical protein
MTAKKTTEKSTDQPGEKAAGKADAPPRSTLIKHSVALAKGGNPIRDMILQAMEAQGMNPYALARAVGGKVTAQSVYNFVSGRSDMTSKFVIHLLTAVGLEVRPKN